MKAKYSIARLSKRLLLLLLGLLSMLSGCDSIGPYFPSDGPNKSQIIDQADDKDGVLVIDVNDAVVRKILAAQKTCSFF